MKGNKGVQGPRGHYGEQGIKGEQGFKGFRGKLYLKCVLNFSKQFLIFLILLFR